MVIKQEKMNLKNCIKNKIINRLSKVKQKKIKDIVNNITNSTIFIIVLGILILAKTLLFYYSTIAATEVLPIETILGTISFIITIVCILGVLPNRTRFISGMIIDILLSLLLFADNIYYIYSSGVLSIAQFTNIQYGNEIIDTLPSLLRLNQILYFLDIICIIILLVTRFLRLEKKKENKKRQITIKVIMGIIGILLFLKIGHEYIEKGNDKIYNKDWQIRESTIFGYHIDDFEKTINIKKTAKYKTSTSMIDDYNNLKDEYEEKYGQIKYEFQGILENYNVIILQLESIQEFVINKKINGKPITPNLNKFLEENIEFSNMYMQSYSTTADSEHSTITSIYPMENGMSFSKYYTNDYDDLFKIFNQADYYTSYMHGNDAYFWNRGKVYERLKVKNLALKDKFQDYEYINGFLSDELLYKQGIEKIKEFPQPFLSFIVSASSHSPYELEGLQDRSKVNIDVGKYKGTYFGNYLEAVNYADYTFGLLIEDLKKEGLYENTAILLFGDHNGMDMYNEEMLDFLKILNPDLTDIDIKLNYTRVVCGLRIPGIGHIEIEKPVSKLDIKPTLAYLCGIQDGFSLGTNMFASKEFVALNNERIITRKYYYDGEWYEIATGQKINVEKIDKDTRDLLEQYYNYMKAELDISNSISINNLLANK